VLLTTPSSSVCYVSEVPLHPSLYPPAAPEHRRSTLALLADDDSGERADPLDPVLLTEIAAGLAASLRHESRHRGCAAVPLLQTSGYAAWLFSWPSGAEWQPPVHPSGVLHVVSGALVERWIDLLHADEGQRRAQAGDLIALGTRLRRTITNEGTDALDVIQVTSPPAPPPTWSARSLQLVG
jgi:hypothetical protein